MLQEAENSLFSIKEYPVFILLMLNRTVQWTMNIDLASYSKNYTFFWNIVDIAKIELTSLKSVFFVNWIIHKMDLSHRKFAFKLK